MTSRSAHAVRRRATDGVALRHSADATWKNMDRVADRTSGVGCLDCDCGRSPAGLVGSAQPDIGLARLVGEIQSREIAISLDYIARLGWQAPQPLFAT